MEFIEANQDEPFMLVMNPTLVHHPPTEESLKADREITPIGRVEIPEVQPSRESVLERQKAAGLEDNNHAGGVIWLDDAVGAIVKHLEELGLRENTVIFFVSDHSSSGKWTCYNGRAGAIVNWPGQIEPGQVSEILAQNVDIAPTVWELCGVETPADRQLQGVSFAEHITEGAPGKRDGAFMELFYQRAVISPDEWKYIAVRFPQEIQQQIEEGKYFTLRGRETTPDKKGKSGPAIPDELYNLKEDPHEKNNLANDPAYAEKLAEMKELMKVKCRELPHAFGEFTES
jgi:arylsulfatase A-like enzyme